MKAWFDENSTLNIEMETGHEELEMHAWADACEEQQELKIQVWTMGESNEVDTTG